jgi:ribose 5-phosphate isomerase A
MTLEALKAQAASLALSQVKSGMVLGLGTGSTAKYFIEGLGEKLAQGELRDICGVATSKASEAQALALGIPLLELTGEPLDLAVDGMDEVDDALNAVKGLGGALTREKIVESCAERLILIGDATKRVRYLGEKAPIPIEIVPFGWQATVKKLTDLGMTVTRRMEGDVPFVTDNGNFIVHGRLAAKADVYALARQMSLTPGVVEHGLFLGMATRAYIATAEGVVTLERQGARV